MNCAVISSKAWRWGTLGVAVRKNDAQQRMECAHKARQVGGDHTRIVAE